MDSNNALLHKRQHIQDHSQANTKYWGYPSRVLPCTKDVGTCEYLDAVYGMHETSMLYTFILWGVILSILLLWSLFRIWRAGPPSHGPSSLISLVQDKATRIKTRYLLPDAPMRSLFGRVSRLQLAILTAISIYLTIFSLVGIVYRTWITPISGTSLYNTRTGLGGWSDRLGALAYALTPFTVLLSQRESLLSLLTGIPYQHFSFLHQWTGRIIFIQSFFHTLGWTLIEGKFYKPQPKVYRVFMGQQYVIFGVIAMALITFLTVFSTKWAIRKTGYEFFKAAHWISAILYIGACWGHWDKLWCWMVPSFALIVFDQGVRFARTVYIHRNGHRHISGFQPAKATIKVLQDENGTVVRLDFDLEHFHPWEAGQHFYLTFPELSLWQSHPFTVASPPETNSRMQHHTYLLRVRDGQTKKLAEKGDGAVVDTILTGPYGSGFPRYEYQHILAVAGGTGVTFTLPIVLEAVRQFVNKKAVIDFVWVVRKSEDLLWLSAELAQLKELLNEAAGLRISLYISRESFSEKSLEKGKEKAATASSVSSLSSDADILEDLLTVRNPGRFSVHFLRDHHPSISEILLDFQERVANVGGAAEIVGSGPETMGTDLRTAIAKAKNGHELGFYWDSRE